MEEFEILVTRAAQSRKAAQEARKAEEAAAEARANAEIQHEQDYRALRQFVNEKVNKLTPINPGDRWV